MDRKGPVNRVIKVLWEGREAKEKKLQKSPKPNHCEIELQRRFISQIRRYRVTVTRALRCSTSFTPANSLGVIPVLQMRPRGFE